MERLNTGKTNFMTSLMIRPLKYLLQNVKFIFKVFVLNLRVLKVVTIRGFYSKFIVTESWVLTTMHSIYYKVSTD